MLHWALKPPPKGYRIKRDLERHVVPAHSNVNEVEQPLVDLFAANALAAPGSYAALPLASHRRTIPTASTEKLRYEAYWVEDAMRCRQSRSAHDELCPPNVVGGPLCEERYSAYGHMRQRDQSKQLGKAMQFEARDGQHYVSPLIEIPPQCPIVTRERRYDKSCRIPEGFTRVLQRASDDYNTTCRPCKVIDLYQPEDYSGRLLY